MTDLELTPEVLAGLQKSLAGMTPAPWEATESNEEEERWMVGARGQLGGKGAIANASVLWYVAMIHNGAPGDTLATEEANARGIAALRNAARSLLEAAEERDRLLDVLMEVKLGLMISGRVSVKTACKIAEATDAESRRRDAAMKSPLAPKPEDTHA